jgi:23S rRNA (adenine2030-N6)-methyltransferase
MNYRHAYHAGNHADVLKHVVMVRILEHLRKKDKPFAVIDAHAGIGVYALDGIEAGKTREWQGGIGKLGEPFASDVESLLAPYRTVIAALNPPGELIRYPGSPELALRLMRGTDRLLVNELHPEDVEVLAAAYARERRVEVTGIDAEEVVKGRLPPPERRGLVLIDPPYEQTDEGPRAIAMLAQGMRRFANGIYALWYPVKADGLDKRMTEAAAQLGGAGMLKVELRVREAFSAGGLAGSGLIIVNPPWKLDDELRLIVPALAARLGLGTWGHAAIDWLVPPK